MGPSSPLEIACGHKYVGMEKAVDLLIDNYGGSWQVLLERLAKKGFKIMEIT